MPSADSSDSERVCSACGGAYLVLEIKVYGRAYEVPATPCLCERTSGAVAAPPGSV